MKYPSKYSNGKEVTAAQYLAEMVCERVALKKKVDLHYRFWLSEEWQKEYKGQITAANKLLKRFDMKAIIHALLTTSGRKIYSLRAPHLVGMIEQAEKHLENQPKPQEKVIVRNLLDKGRQKNYTKNILDKLKELEDGTTD